ncbi:gliding motility-associated-like protein [Lewinella aquimaris]|uniref:Gliding motility-associated-like protein n=1 Tax=Neolewinella aquimaris TaxID=1835722 RepID=A0A840DYU1_9BACT|nr:gliding motility-associated C-terminal domain-containing protein [Neolewinella aquimaris]MBB4078434.1 gliding motility-associated-like protein [Neolewinella aquimaris]
MMKAVTALFFLALPVVCLGQNPDFFLNGAARQVNDSCFQLTAQEATFQVGSIWYPVKVDLRKNFDLVMEMNFGCLDELGADGIVFGLQPVSASVGQAGEGLGIGGIRPALGVEFDTYQNLNRLDPSFDHVAIMANGAVTHSGADNLAGPVRARADSDNIETCSDFPLRVTWDAATTTLEVYFDCSLRLTYTEDIVSTIFGGDPMVYYGFAAATGGLTNRQEICFTFNSFQKQLSNVTMCPGGKVLLDVSGGESYEWSPSAGLSSTTAASVEASPDSTTIYSVKILDGCGIPLFDTVRIEVAGDSAFVDLGPDTTICPGEPLLLDVAVPTAVYTWSEDSLRGPTAEISQAGVYSVTATRTDIICTAADRVRVDLYEVPVFDVGPADTSLCIGDTLRIIAGYPIGQASLDGGLPFDTLDLRRGGFYRFQFVHPCETTYDEVDLRFGSCREYYLPTAFSPNGDGRNDYYYPQDNGDIVRIARFSVYNRWGGLIFDAVDIPPNEPRAGWDGQVDGQPAPIGSYLWVMEATFRNGSHSVEAGGLLVIR